MFTFPSISLKLYRNPLGCVVLGKYTLHELTDVLSSVEQHIAKTSFNILEVNKFVRVELRRSICKYPTKPDKRYLRVGQTFTLK